MSARRPADGQPAGQPNAKKAAPAPAFDINAIRAQIAAKKAALEAGQNKSGSNSPAPGSASTSAAATPARATPPISRVSVPAPAPGPAALPPTPTMDAATAARIAAVKARIEAVNTKMANPYLSGAPVAAASSTTSTRAPPPPQVQGVSSVALHPLLMGDSAGGAAGGAGAGPVGGAAEKRALRDRYKTMAPKFSTVKANAAIAQAAAAAAPARAAPTPVVANPYASTPSSGPSGARGGPGAGPGADDMGAGAATTRRSRKMQFSAPGKYVRQGDILRDEIKMEELRQRIANASRRAGLDSEFDTLERSLKRQAPPEVEWWDEAILPKGMTYDDVDKADIFMHTSDESLITHLIQHPIPILAPSDRKQPERGLMLTKKEQRKMRRQRRLADLEDKRDRQKMGLIPPDPPKVRLANLMKVLTSDAVQDPTKIEAKVKREVAMRAIRHEKDNEERKLTPEERAEKTYQKMVEKERNGLYASVYKIKYLSNGRHIFKVRETAKHDLLSGLCIFHPQFALVIVEGVDKKIKHYRQLMLNRIDWTEEARPHGEGYKSGDDESGSDGEDTAAANPKAPDVDGPDMAENKCELIWEGEIPERTFKIFRARHAETDGGAKDWLTPKWEGMWDLAKRWMWNGEDL